MATLVIPIDEYVPARVPVQSVVSLDASAINLGTLVTGDSAAAFELWSASAWLVGDMNGQARLVAGNEPFVIPSGRLSGWYAKSVSGTISLIVTGAQKVAL